MTPLLFRDLESSHHGVVQHSFDADTAAAYGNDQPDYGGLYYVGDQLVVLFTANLDQHRRHLSERVGHPGQLAVHQGTRTWIDIEETNLRLQHRLLAGPHPVTGVNRVGIGMSDGQFVITVGIDHDDEDLVATVRAVAAPDAVEISRKERPRRLPRKLGPGVGLRAGTEGQTT